MINFLFSYIFLGTLYQAWAQSSFYGQANYPMSPMPLRDVVDLKVFYESLCAACKYELTHDLVQIARQLGDRVNIELIPYGKCKTFFANGTWMFDAQHGPDEAYGNKLHNCAIDMLDPKTSLFFNSCLVSGSNKGSNDISVDQCAPLFGVNGEAIKQCAQSIKGSLLLKAAGEKTPPLSQVPCAFIDGVPCLENVFERVVQACRAPHLNTF